MTNIITTKNLSVEDTSKLKTGDTRKEYNMAKKKGGCPPGKHMVKGKCVAKKKSSSKKSTGY